MKMKVFSAEVYSAKVNAIDSVDFELIINNNVFKLSPDVVDDLAHSIRVAFQEREWIAMQESEGIHDECGVPFA